MKEKIYNILIASFLGVGGYTTAFVILESLFYLVSELPELILPKAFFQTYLMEIMLLQLFYAYTATYLFNSLFEEGIRFLIIKKWRIVNPYGFILGLSWGVIENLYRHPEDIGVIPLLHIVNAGIICYFVKKNKSILGLAVAIIIHTGFNLLINWAVQ